MKRITRIINISCFLGFGIFFMITTTLFWDSSWRRWVRTMHLFIICKSWIIHYYIVTLVKLMIWRKMNMFPLCISLFFSFFLFQCYSKHNKILYLNISIQSYDIQILFMFMVLILQCCILHSITKFFYILHII